MVYDLIYVEMALLIGFDGNSVAHRAIYYLALYSTSVATLSPIPQCPGLCVYLPPEEEAPASDLLAGGRQHGKEGML